MIDPYQILCIPQDATLEQIRNARDSIIKTIDMLPNHMKLMIFPPTDTIYDSYNILSNSITRYTVDLSLSALEEERELLELREKFMELLLILNLDDISKEGYIRKFENSTTIEGKLSWYKFIQSVLRTKYGDLLKYISYDKQSDLNNFDKVPLEEKIKIYQEGFKKFIINNKDM